VAIKYINIAVGSKLANGEQQTKHGSTGAAQANDVSLAYDDTTVLTFDLLKAAVEKALFQARAQGLK
jgi:uncharacterized protein YggE